MKKVRIIYFPGFEGIGVSPRLVKQSQKQYGRECRVEWETDSHIEGRMVPVPAKYHQQEVIILDETWRSLYCEDKEYGFLSFPKLSFIEKLNLQEIDVDSNDETEDPEESDIPLITFQLDDKVVVFEGQKVYVTGRVFEVTSMFPNMESGIITYDSDIKRSYLPDSSSTTSSEEEKKKQTDEETTETLESILDPLNKEQKGLTTVTKNRKPFTQSKLKQLKGIDPVIERLLIEVIHPFSDLLDQQNYADPTPLGGLLLYGPPGTGKTEIAIAIAEDLNIPLVRMDLGSIGSPLVHETAVKIAEKFAEAASYSQGAILFIDEIDAIAGHRHGMSTHDKENVNALLQELDPKKRPAHVFVIAATNHMSELDTAVLRSGRFDTKIGVPPPDATGRFDILASRVKKLSVDPTQITHHFLKTFSKQMIGYVGADINTFVEKVVAQHRNRIRKNSTSPSTKISVEDFEAALESVTPLCELELNITIPKITISELYGADAIYEQLKQELLFSIQPEDFRQDLPATTADGILLYGPPGTGKTSLANALANELNILFMPVNLGEIKSKHIGDTAKNINSLFEKARLFRPILLFFDEIDSLGNRQKSGEAHNNDAINALLTQLSGGNDNEGVLCIAATNLIEDIDPALKRAGRFGHHVEVTYPDPDGYRAQIKGLLSNIDHTVSDESIEQIVAHFTREDRPYSQAEVTRFYQRLLRHMRAHTKEGEPATDEIILSLMEESDEH